MSQLTGSQITSLTMGYRCYYKGLCMCLHVRKIIENKIVQMTQLINHSIRTSIVKRAQRVRDFQMCSQHTPASVKMKMCNLYTFNKIQYFYFFGHMDASYINHRVQCDCVHGTWVDSWALSIVMGHWIEPPTCFSCFLSLEFSQFQWTVWNCNAAKVIIIQHIRPVNRFIQKKQILCIFSQNARQKSYECGNTEFWRNILLKVAGDMEKNVCKHAP